MLALLAPVLVFGLVIFVHEFGHFLAAKAVGVYAPRFAIGFGPSLWRVRYGETEYTLNILPLGGYVRMASRHDEGMAFIEGGSEDAARRHASDPDYDPNAMVPFGPHPVPADRLFESKSIWSRLVIMLAGVSMNIVLALVVSVVLALSYGRSVVLTRVVGVVHAIPGLPELSRGLALGDTIESVNGVAVRTWNDVDREILASRGVLTVTTNRASTSIPLRGLPPDSVAASVDFFEPPVLDSIIAGGQAAMAGLRSGDSVVAISGHPVRSWVDLVDRVSHSPGQLLVFDVVRRGRHVSIPITPRSEKASDPETGDVRVLGKIGAAPRDLLVRQPLHVGEALGAGWRATWMTATSIVDFLGKLLTGQLSVRTLGGPIAITKASVQAARSGVEQLFWLIAFLSVNVAILNLLPIPILDGGQILVNVIEAAKGSPFSLRTRENILRLGLVAIALIFAMVMYNDTRDLFSRLFGWVARLFG